MYKGPGIKTQDHPPPCLFAFFVIFTLVKNEPEEKKKGRTAWSSNNHDHGTINVDRRWPVRIWHWLLFIMSFPSGPPSDREPARVSACVCRGPGLA